MTEKKKKYMNLNKMT